jgi:DinB family protein
MTDREVLDLDPSIGLAAEVGRWLAALEDGRRDSLEQLIGIADAALDVLPPGADNTIGSSLYHLALIEADWLVDDIFGEDLAESDLAGLFPFDDRDGDGRLSQITGVGLRDHLDRLARVRRAVLDRVGPMPLEDFITLRSRPRYDVSPVWVIHHLLQHEAEHRAEIGWLRRLIGA